MQVYRVSEGNRTKWFFDEGDARQFARDRFDDCDGPIPFVQPIDAVEMLTHLNELELGRKTFLESYASKKQRLGDVYV
jgi:hypothetical protein